MSIVKAVKPGDGEVGALTLLLVRAQDMDSSRGGSAVPTMMRLWSCSTCRAVNNPQSRACVRCARPRANAGDEERAPEPAGGSAVPSLPMAMRMWSCSACGAVNDPQSRACLRCARPCANAEERAPEPVAPAVVLPARTAVVPPARTTVAAAPSPYTDDAYALFVRKVVAVVRSGDSYTLPELGAKLRSMGLDVKLHDKNLLTFLSKNSDTFALANGNVRLVGARSPQELAAVRNEVLAAAEELLRSFGGGPMEMGLFGNYLLKYVAIATRSG